MKEAQLKALYQELVLSAIKPVPSELLTESLNSANDDNNRPIFERVVNSHSEYKILKQMFRMVSHSKMLSVYKRHDP